MRGIFLQQSYTRIVKKHENLKDQALSSAPETEGFRPKFKKKNPKNKENSNFLLQRAVNNF